VPEGEIPEADDLYGLDPTEFTAARNALAKRLKAEGRKEHAAAVAQLRRPTAAAWALDRVARDQPGLVAEALEAGARLREATDAAVAGDPGALREAAAADRAASDAVVDAAAAHLGARGQASRAQLADNLRAAVLDDGIADEVRRGVLAVDHGPAGFGFGFDAAPAGAAAPAAAPAKPAAKKAAATKGATEKGAGTKRPDAGEARARREAEKRAREEAEERSRQERRRLAELEAQVKRLDHRFERLARAADRAEEEAKQARAQADAAALEAEAARRALDDAT
jgi:hypothetical protein